MEHIPKYKTPYEVSQMIGCSRQTISWDIKKGKLIADATRGVDVNHPLVIEYMRRKKLAIDHARSQPTNGDTPQIVKKEREKYGTTPVQESENNEYTLEAWSPHQKAYEETRLKKAQADKAVLDYAEKLGAVIDIDSLNKIMSKFMDYLLTELVYLPSNVSDVCWLRAKTAEVPEKAIEEVLADKTREIIEQGKKLAGEMLPPPDGLNYVIMDPQDAQN